MKTIKRYKLTENQDKLGLFQIQAIIDIPMWNVKAGDLGGWVESEKNLSQNGKGWILEGASVQGESLVRHALLKNGTHVYGGSLIQNGIFEETQIHNSVIFDGNVMDSSINECQIHEHLEANRAYLLRVIANQITVINSTLESESTIRSEGYPVRILSSFIRVGEGKILETAELKNVQLKGHSLRIETPTYLDNVNFLKKDVIVTCRNPISNPKKSLCRENVVIAAGYDSESVQVDLETIVLEQVKITGNIRLSGYYLGLCNTVIRDSVEILMTGVIQDSVLSEFSQIKDENADKQRGVHNVSLSGDDIYTFE